MAAITEQYLRGIPNIPESECSIELIGHSLILTIHHAHSPTGVLAFFSQKNRSETIYIARDSIVSVECGEAKTDTTVRLASAAVGVATFGLLGGIAASQMAKAYKAYPIKLSVMRGGKQLDIVFKESRTSLETYKSIITFWNSL